MTAERDSMTLNEVFVPALEVEERSDEGAVTVTGWCQLRVASSFLL